MRIPIVTVSLLALAGCVAPSTPEPQPAPMPTKAPPPPVPVPPTSSDWRDWPLTPGDWSYSRTGDSSTRATFGVAGQKRVLAIHCNLRKRTITLEASNIGTGDMTIRTSSSARTLPTTVTLYHYVPPGDPTPDNTSAVELPAADPLFDAMGFSRGRFVIERPGQPTLVIPAWPEILRVAEDCRG